MHKIQRGDYFIRGWIFHYEIFTLGWKFHGGEYFILTGSTRAVLEVAAQTTSAQTVSWSIPIAFYIDDLSRFNTLRPRQDGRCFPNDTFERIFLKDNIIILIKISLKFVPKGPINNIPALVQIMAWRRSGYKPLTEPMMVSLPTHICVTRPQWVNCEWIELLGACFQSVNLALCDNLVNWSFILFYGFYLGFNCNRVM